MQHNQLPIQFDIKSILYSNFSLSELTNLLMRISKTEMAHVTRYLETCLSIPFIFLNLLTKDLNASKPFDAMRLLEIYRNRYGSNNNAIKQALEVDPRLITFLFEKYKDDGRALSVLANAITRIACPYKLRELWKTQGLNSAYYSLVTNNVPEIKIEILLESLKDLDSEPIKMFIQLLGFIHGIYDEEIEKRDWSRSECYPMNLSGIGINSDDYPLRRGTSVNLYFHLKSELTCAVIQNMKYRSLSNFPVIMDRDLFGVNFNIQYDLMYIPFFRKCDMQYASLIESTNNDDFRKKILRFYDCQLEHADICGFMIDLSPFLGTMRDKIYSYTESLNNPIKYLGEAVNRFPRCLINVLEANINGMVLTYNSAIVIKSTLLSFTETLQQAVNQVTDINELHQLLNGLSNHYNLLHLNVHDEVYSKDRQLVASDFTKDTNAWYQLITTLKQRIMLLMSDESLTPFHQLSKGSVRVLSRLNIERGKQGFFERIDAIFSEMYLQYQLPVGFNNYKFSSKKSSMNKLT